ncbi:MAG: hypothetical protein DIJKHBIC_03422 [Thermoanaerobaculia bacterium]|nr:hypothetical protein [Thermoanaerobaculia bacterium]
MSDRDLHPSQGSRAPVFLDERILAIDKPAGVSMAVSSRQGRDEATVVRNLLAAAGVEIPEPLPLMVHRLDVGTSGLVLLAKTREVHRDLSRLFQERAVQKTYRALVFGSPVPAKGRFESPLGRDPRDGRKMKVDPEGKPAITNYQTLRRHTGLSDLELFPETGRTHQIRVHLASRGHPIAGDSLYGGSLRWRGIRDPGVRGLLRDLAFPLLHAARLVLPEIGLSLEAPLPRAYESVLESLGRG